MGSAFYKVFPPAVHESTIWTILVVLIAALAVGAMACTIVSDPIRKLLGFHRNRLEALLDEVERELIVLSHKRIRQKPQ
jgi:peptidoglycan/LPS O-acetylase OafA/YrhL